MESTPQLLNFLVSNNIKFTFKDGKITIILNKKKTQKEITHLDEAIKEDTQFEDAQSEGDAQSEEEPESLPEVNEKTHISARQKFISIVEDSLVNSGHFSSVIHNIACADHDRYLKVSFRYQTARIVFGFNSIVIFYSFQTIEIKNHEPFDLLMETMPNWFSDVSEHFVTLLVTGFSFIIKKPQFYKFTLADKNIEVFNKVDEKKRYKVSFRELNKDLPHDRDVITFGFDDCYKQIMSYK
jgi:hypothetical protein